MSSQSEGYVYAFAIHFDIVKVAAQTGTLINFALWTKLGRFEVKKQKLCYWLSHFFSFVVEDWFVEKMLDLLLDSENVNLRQEIVALIGNMSIERKKQNSPIPARIQMDNINQLILLLHEPTINLEVIIYFITSFFIGSV